MKTAVKIFLRKGEKFLFLKQKTNEHGFSFWELPGGRVEEKENPPDAIKRELKEETGLSVINFHEISKINFLNSDWIEILYEGSYEEGEIVLNPKEHENYQWLDTQSARQLNDPKNNKQLFQEIEILEKYLSL